MAETFLMRALGRVRTARTDLSDDYWGSVVSSIELDPDVVARDALEGLDAFSHVEVVFVFDQVDERTVDSGVQHPRGNPDWPAVGIFAQRKKARPNRIGITRCRIERVDGLELVVRGLDAVDGTPVLDLKPWMDEFGPGGDTTQPVWATALMTHYFDD